MYDPAPQSVLQSVSTVCPIASLYLPATQEVQAAVPLAYVPLGQVVASYSQLDVPARLNLSVAHGLHVVCPVWSWYVPA